VDEHQNCSTRRTDRRVTPHDFQRVERKKRSSFHHIVSVRKRRTIKCTKTLWFNYSRVSWKTEPRKERGGFECVYHLCFAIPSAHFTYVSLHCLPLGPYLGFTAVTVSFFSQQFCRVFDFFPCILYPLMYARMFVLFGIDWFVVVSIA